MLRQQLAPLPDEPAQLSETCKGEKRRERGRGCDFILSNDKDVTRCRVSAYQLVVAKFNVHLERCPNQLNCSQ